MWMGDLSARRAPIAAAPPLAWQTELVLKLAGFVPSALLGIAAALEPDSPNDLACAPPPPQSPDSRS